MKIARRGLIVGYDPGITAGISILDTHGNIVSLISKRDVGKSDIIKMISKFGRPIIISTDKNPLPKSVEKLASLMGTKVVYPEMSMTHLEKDELLKSMDIKVKNRHEADALAASIKAWKKHRRLFTKVDNTLRDIGMTELFDIVLQKLLRKESYTIHDAVRAAMTEKYRFT